MPNSDNSFEEEESDNSDACEKGKGKKTLMSMVKSSKKKFKRAAVHRRGNMEESVSLSSDEEQMIMS